MNTRLSSIKFKIRCIFCLDIVSQHTFPYFVLFHFLSLSGVRNLFLFCPSCAARPAMAREATFHSLQTDILWHN